MNDLFLNDLLRISTETLKKTKIKFNQYNGEIEPMKVYLRNPEEINDRWLFWRKNRRYFNVGEIAVCFFQLSYDTWLLSTVKEVTTEYNITDGINYAGVEIEELKPYFGRVVVKYKKKHRSQVMSAANVFNELEVLQILPSVYDGDSFPGYDNVRLSYEELAMIVHRQKRDWVSALKNQKAVYLITDKQTGKHYVGSAYGDNGMLLKRWEEYVKNGHGGNKLLRLITEDENLGLDYIKKNFQYSILENYNARVQKEIILERENWWKETLGSRAFGLNSN